VKPFLSKRNLLALATLTISIILAIHFKPQDQSAVARKPLTDIQDIETLRGQFNRDAGKTRLILLLSPT
jgi:hypothetical protein